MGKIDPAIETYRKIKGAPEIEAKAANNLGILYLSLDQPEMALKEFDRSIKLNYKLPDSHYNLGKCREFFLHSRSFLEVSLICHLNIIYQC